ncbi:MAG: 5-methyltetrahydropteroyltriglutamate--homocysteine S-methyltransferase [Acidobacteria bacterium]|nr:5-methyltetrahydropteroyltriglutamate--homocysteine S-methyltransferase [Acidobacteriota bacterium]
MAGSCSVCRADHIGSLLRPRELRDAHKAHVVGTLDHSGFRSVQDQAIRDAIAMQEAAGLGVVTDGEFRRRSWFAGFVDAVDGLVHKDTNFNFIEGDTASVNVPVPHAEAPIRRRGGIAVGELAFALQVARLPVKITLPSPAVIHFFRGPGGIDQSVYPDEGDYWCDLVEVYRAEVQELGQAGLEYLQLDEVPIALFCDAQVRERLTAWGWDWEQLLSRYISAANAVLEVRPRHTAAGMHLCRGNFRGKWIGTGGYEPVAERLFNEIAVDQFLLEFDSERAGDFAPLRFLPEGKSVVLGLVSTKTATMEDEDFLLRRIEDAARYVPMERLAVSPQCGFGTTVGGAPMDEDTQRRKLELVGRVAEKAWR